MVKRYKLQGSHLVIDAQTGDAKFTSANAIEVAEVCNLLNEASEELLNKVHEKFSEIWEYAMEEPMSEEFKTLVRGDILNPENVESFINSMARAFMDDFIRELERSED